MPATKYSLQIEYLCGCKVRLIARFSGYSQRDWSECKQGHDTDNFELTAKQLTEASKKRLYVMSNLISYALTDKPNKEMSGKIGLFTRKRNPIMDSQEFKDLKAAMEKGIKKPN